jgi:hypothetical protein
VVECLHVLFHIHLGLSLCIGGLDGFCDWSRRSVLATPESIACFIYIQYMQKCFQFQLCVCELLGVKYLLLLKKKKEMVSFSFFESIYKSPSFTLSVHQTRFLFIPWCIIGPHGYETICSPGSSHAFAAHFIH